MENEGLIANKAKIILLSGLFFWN